MTPLHTVERELLLHADALRALATDLVGARAADDLVQETAMRALRSPPPEPQRLFAWLATILRHLASKHRRSQRRREARERRAARDEVLPPADALLERRDMLRRVTDAVLALPEPYQATLIRRYFEEQTPSAIAARDGVPLATVKSRLQRGLALLRTQLDRERSDWRRALLRLTGTTPLLLYGTGTLLMTTTSKLVTAAGALLAAALWYAFAGNNGSQPTRADAAGPTAAAALADATLPRDPTVARLEVPTTAPTADDLSHPFAFVLQCTVVDCLGLPVPDAVLFAAPRASALDVCPARTGADGKVTLSWCGKEAAMTMAIGVRRDQVNQELQEVTVRAGAPQQLVLLAELESGIKIHLREAVKADGTMATVVGKTTDCERVKAKVSCSSCHEGPQLRSVFDGRLTMGLHLHPEAHFADLLLPSPPPVVDQMTEVTEWTVAGIGLGGPGRRQNSHLTGVVYGADGKPVDDVLVVCRGADGEVIRTRTGHGGQFACDVAAGSQAIHAGGSDQGLATANVEVGAGETQRRELFLELGAAIRGRAIGADGAPLAQWRVEYVGTSWSDVCITHDDGTFVLPNLPQGPAQLLLWPRSGTSLPAAIEADVLPDSSEVVFDLRQRGEAKGRLRVFAALPDGVDRSAAEARVWQRDSGRGAAMAQTKDGAFVLDGLAAGFYRIEIGAESCGWRELSVQWVDGKGLADLGRIELPRPGRVQLVRGPDLDGLPEFYLRRADCDVRAEDVEAARGDELVMPAGEWLCLWKAKDGALHRQLFTVRGGDVVEVRVGGA